MANRLLITTEGRSELRFRPEDITIFEVEPDSILIHYKEVKESSTDSKSAFINS